MAVINRDPETRTRSRYAMHSCATGAVPAIAKSQNDSPVIRKSHRTDLNSNLTGELTMSFLKNFLVEEDGQDLVEYGLVVAGIVVAGAAAFLIYTGALNGAMTALGAKVTAAL
jgi:Flp pilus assembly pilin Flp